AGFRGFTILEKASGQGPEPAARRDRALAQQHLILPGEQTAGHHARVLIVDRAAVVADVAFPGIPLRYPRYHQLAAVAAILHELRVDRTRLSITPGGTASWRRVQSGTGPNGMTAAADTSMAPTASSTGATMERCSSASERHIIS